MHGNPDPRPPADDTPRERKAELLNRDWDNRLIHPDARDPAAELDGQLERLIREYRNATDSLRDDEAVALLHEKADELADEIGGGHE